MFARTLAGAQGVTTTLWSQRRLIDGEATEPYYELGGETNNGGQAVVVTPRINYPVGKSKLRRTGASTVACATSEVSLMTGGSVAD
jgi:hypothetical protein